MREINLPMSELTNAIGYSSYEITCYLDLQEHRVIELFDEYETQLEYLVENAPQTLDDLAVIISHIRQQEDIIEWIQDILIETAQVHYASDLERFELLPKLDSRTAYSYMEAFIETVDDDTLQNRLYTAIGGRGAFRRFKDILLDHPDYRQRWFDFEEQQKAEFVQSWLKANNLSLKEE